MADPRAVMEKIRSLGGNVLIDAGRLRVINRERLPVAALDYIKSHAKELGIFLGCEADFEERAAIIEFDGGLTRDKAEYITRFLMSHPPDGVDPSEWSWFVGHASQIIDQSMPGRAA